MNFGVYEKYDVRCQSSCFKIRRGKENIRSSTYSSTCAARVMSALHNLKVNWDKIDFCSKTKMIFEPQRPYFILFFRKIYFHYLLNQSLVEPLWVKNLKNWFFYLLLLALRGIGHRRRSRFFGFRDHTRWLMRWCVFWMSPICSFSHNCERLRGFLLAHHVPLDRARIVYFDWV